MSKSKPTQGSGKRRGRIENLTPWKPGQSGNPGGRVKAKPITAYYLALLDQKHPTDTKGRTYGELLAIGQLNAAIRGKADAAREITNRVEGLVLGEVESSESTFQLIIRPRPEGAAPPKPKEE